MRYDSGAPPMKNRAGRSIFERSARRAADALLFGVTVAELALLVVLTPTFTLVDWIYVVQHVLVLGIALVRRPPERQDRSVRSGVAVAVTYAYPYAQVAYLRWVPGDAGWPAAGLVVVSLAACLSFLSLLSIGRSFGVRPAARSLVTRGPYRLVRHPMYLSYLLSDVGYNLQEWNAGTVLLTLCGWLSLVYRIKAEEAILSHDPGWVDFKGSVRYRLLPGLW